MCARRADDSFFSGIWGAKNTDPSEPKWRRRRSRTPSSRVAARRMKVAQDADAAMPAVVDMNALARTTLEEAVRAESSRKITTSLGTSSPSRTTRATRGDCSDRDVRGRRASGGAIFARRASSVFHHRRLASAIPRPSAKPRADCPLPTHSATSFDHCSALNRSAMMPRA